MPEHRRRRDMPETRRNPLSPFGLQRRGRPAVLPLLDDAMASPVSRRLAATDHATRNATHQGSSASPYEKSRWLHDRVPQSECQA